jgi:diguanylate cyclase (GGDEF)-like protein
MKKVFLNLKTVFLSFLISLVAFLALGYFNRTVVYGKDNEKNVLFISSYDGNFMSVPDQIEGVRSVLEPRHIQFDVEYMDTKRFDTQENVDIFYNMLKYKMSVLEPYDAIIVGDDHALQFAMDYQEDLFKGLPITFLGINDFNRAIIAAENHYITGIVEETSIKDNIELGIKFNPKATKVVAIVDSTLTGLGNREQFYSYEDTFKNHVFEDINVSEYTFEELGEVFEKITDDTIVLYFSMYTDKTGAYLTIPEAVAILREYIKVPIYRSEVGGVGLGVLGGKMISYSEAGKIAANMIVDVFQGKPIESIDLVTESPNFYTFDYELLKMYQIDKNLIPKDSILINKKISFYEEYRHLVWATFGIMFFLFIIIIISVTDNIKHRILQKQLQESHEELTQTFEELTASEEELRAQYETIQKHAEELEILYQKYSIVLESTDSGVCEFDIENDSIMFSKNFINNINPSIKENDNIYRVLNLLFTDDSKELLIKDYLMYKNGEKNELNIQLPVYDFWNNKKWILIRGKGVKDSKGTFKMLYGILLDITRFKEQEEYIEHLANHDYLTRLPNRMYFMEKLNHEMKHEKPGAIFLLDIDNFKGVNDTLGHIYGDKLLEGIAHRLTDISNEKVFISRFGGDEFLILISNEARKEVIEKYVTQVMQLFNDPFLLDYKEYYIQFSIGVSTYPHDTKDIDQLLMNVDTAMYQVKRNGKNNYMFYCSTMLDELKDKAEIEGILRSALKNDGFHLVYQPQVDVKTGDIVSFEALLRLKEHKIPPNKFIAIAEENGMIKDIGRWVAKEAVEQVARWKGKGFLLKPVAINFSSKQIRDEEFCDYLDKLLAVNHVDPKYIEIEITESILLEKTDNTIIFLNKLKNKGIKIALDDFGTGFSSLNYLTYIPVDKIKLDKSLCEKFLELDNIKVMDSIIALVHSLHIKITAEGIEELDQFKRLKLGGCDYIQGYLFSKPLPVFDLEQVYNTNYLCSMLE